MVPRVDLSGHLYRFTVSVGLVLMAASVGLPWLVLREQDALLVTEEVRAQLSPPAQEAVLRRQRDYLWLVENYRWGSALLFVIGAGLSVVGLKRWVERQRVVDGREDTELATAEVQLRQLTPSESAERIEREVAEIQGSASEAQSPEPPAPAPEVPATSEAPDLDAQLAQLAAQQIRSDIQRVESLVGAQLRAAFGSTHRSARDVEIVHPAGRGRVDFALISRGADPSIYVDVKIVRDGFLARERALSGLAGLVLATGNVSRDALLLLVLVFVESGAGSELDRQDLQDRVRTVLSSVNGPELAILMTTEDELSRARPDSIRKSVVPGSASWLSV